MPSGATDPPRGAPHRAQRCPCAVVVRRSAGASRRLYGRFGAHRRSSAHPEGSEPAEGGSCRRFAATAGGAVAGGACSPIRCLDERRHGLCRGSPRRAGRSAAGEHEPGLAEGATDGAAERRPCRQPSRRCGTRSRCRAARISPAGPMVACSGSRRCHAVVDAPVAASAALALLGDRPTPRNGTVDGLPALERDVGPATMPTMRLGVGGQRCGAAAVRRCGGLRPGRTRRRRRRDARHPRTVPQCPPAAGGALVLPASRRCRCDPRGCRLSSLIQRRPPRRANRL